MAGLFDDLIPQQGGRVPASIRNNNPGAQWPGQSATRFGSSGFETLNDGQGNRIARFDTPEAGAAAQFDLLSRRYAGMPLNEAIRKWSGGNSSDAYTASVARAIGMQPTDVLSSDILSDPARAVPFAKAMARIEAGRDFPMSDEQWTKAHQMAFAGPSGPSASPGVDAINSATAPRSGATQGQAGGMFDDLIPTQVPQGGGSPSGRTTFDVPYGEGNRPPITSPAGFQSAFGSFDGVQVDPALRQRGQDIEQIGAKYGLTDPQEILAADRRAASMQDTTSGVLNELLQGASFGASEEAKAAARAALGQGSYAQNLAAEREGMRRFERDNPGTAMAAEIGGALLTAPFLPTATVARGAGLAGRMASGALTSAGYGGLYGFGTGEGGLGDRATNAATGAAIGGAAGGALPAIFAGAGKAVQGINAVAGNPASVVRGLVNPDAEALRRVGVAMSRDNGGTPEEALTRAVGELSASGYPSVLADAGGEATRAMARSAANTSPEGRQAIQSVAQGRFETQGERARDVISTIMGSPGNNVARVEELRAAAQKANRPLYEKAYREADGGVWNPDLEALIQAPAVKDAIRAATKTGQNRAVIEGVGPIRNPFVSDEAGNLVLPVDSQGNRALPNLRFWDVVKRNLDDEISTAAIGGNRAYAADLRQLKGQLLGVLDQASPTYAKARSTAASFFGAEDALEAGETFVTSRMRNDEARAAIAKMKPAERELFAEGFARGLINRVGEVRDRVNVVNQIFSSPAARERIGLALGPKRAAEIEAFVRRENVMDLLRQAMGNSTTARQLQEIGLAGGAGALVTGGDLMDPKGWLTAAAVYGGRRGFGKVDERVARRVADILVTDDPVQLARAIKAVSSSGTLGNALRTIEQNLAKLVAPSGVNGNALPGMVAPSRAEKDQ